MRTRLLFAILVFTIIGVGLMISMTDERRRRQERMAKIDAEIKETDDCRVRPATNEERKA